MICIERMHLVTDDGLYDRKAFYKVKNYLCFIKKKYCSLKKKSCQHMTRFDQYR